MSSQRYTIDGAKPFTRMKNNLIENQRWWPAFIKNDGQGGLTVDPVLFASNFGPITTGEDGERMDESNQPGIRVELITDTGTDPANAANAYVEVRKSGTNDAVFAIRNPAVSGSDGQDIMLVAPSAEGVVTGVTMPTGIPTSYTGFSDYAPAGGIPDAGWASLSYAATGVDANEQQTGLSYGPFPVYATLQDLADIIDAYQNTGRSWLPHGLAERPASPAFLATYTDGVTTMQPVNAALNTDRRAADAGVQGSAGRAGLHANVWRATVFMPMCLDVNQFSKNMTAFNGVSEPRYEKDAGGTPAAPYLSTGGFAKGFLNVIGSNQRAQATSRYDPDPTGTDSSSLQWKIVGESGDHKIGPGFGPGNNSLSPTIEGTLQQYSGDKTAADLARMQQGFMSGDSSAVPNPKYRMRMCLAIFLKDGRYEPTDGCLVPYVYDSSRTIGGINTTTAYDTWPGIIGYGGKTYYNGFIQPTERNVNLNSSTNQAIKFDSSAQIYPGHGFVQGPLSPARQSANFDFNAFVLPATSEERTADGSGVWGSATINNAARQTQPNNFGIMPNPKRAPIWTVQFSADGLLTLKIPVSSTVDIYPTTFNATAGMPVILRGIKVAGLAGINVDNEWFLPVPPTRGSAVPAHGMSDDLVKSINGWWTISSISGPASHTFEGDTVDAMTITIDTGQSAGVIPETNATSTTGTPSSGAFIQQGFVQGPMYRAISGTSSDDTSWNLYGGAFIGAVPSSFHVAPLVAPGGGTLVSNSLSQGPGRLIQRRTAFASYGGLITNNQEYPLATDASPYNSSDVSNPAAPNKSTRGQGTLRIPPGFPAGTSQYRGMWGESAAGDRTGSQYTDFKANAGSDIWATQILMTPLWSNMCQETGRHAWDHIIPSGWTCGRNRPWPGHYRQGEAVSNAPPFTLNLQILDPSALDAFGFKSRWTNTADSFVPTRKYGLRELGCSPIWLDAEFVAYFPQIDNRMSIIEFDVGRASAFGRNSFVTELSQLDVSGPYSTEFGFRILQTTSGDPNRTAPNTGEKIRNGQSFITPRPVFWAWGGASAFNTGDWVNGDWKYGSQAGKGYAGFGDLSVPTGAGGNFTLDAGVHKVRTVFTSAGMTCIVDGKNKGTDPTSGSPVSQIAIKSADFHCGLTTEDTVFGSSNRISFQNQPTFKTQPQIGTQSMDFMQVDSMILRHIPSRAMLPFRVETRTIFPSANIAKFTSLQVEADHVAPSVNRDIRVNICAPGVSGSGTVDQVPGAPLAGFENLDMAFAGGIGSVDLTDLPSSVFTDGFTIQYLITIPSAEDEQLHPIDWNAIPIIRNWTVEYDLKPTATLSVVGNTYNGDITPPIDTKVGHIVSFRIDAATTDPDRKVKFAQFEFGDGTTTDWLELTEGATASLDTAHTYVSTATGLTARAKVKDDNDNISDYSPTILINVANAPPVAILRAIPSMIRAGQAVRLDATTSYDVNAGGTVSNFTFTPGDGSADVGPQGTAYVDHTYATAGEFQATVTCQDADGTTSNTAKAVIKVLPATLVIPLTLNTAPSGFSRTRAANLTQTTVLDAVYPEISDTGQRNDEFSLTGQFLRDTADADIMFMEELLASGALVEFEWQSVNYTGTPDSKTFVGRMVSFDYQREGGQHGQTPYTASFIREAGLGA